MPEENIHGIKKDLLLIVEVRILYQELIHQPVDFRILY